MSKEVQQVSKPKSVAFYEKNSWYHRTKTLLENGAVKYSKKGGFKTEKEAEASYQECEEAFKKAYRKFYIKNKTGADVMLKDYLLYWFEDIFSQRAASPSRRVGAYVVYDLLLPCMEQDIKVKYITSDYLNGLLEQVAKISLSAASRGRSILNMALGEAVVEGIIKINPVPMTKSYRQKKPHIRVLSKEKTKILLKAASKSNWYLEILLALFCGLRRGEIMGLKFGDFDLEQRTVCISRQLSSEFEMERGGSDVKKHTLYENVPKTPNSNRMLRVPDVIIEQLKIRKMQADLNKVRLGEEYQDKDYVSCQENGIPHSPTSIYLSLTKLCKRNGLPHITVHGLRHMYATILVESGVPLIKISALLGHSSIHTTFQYYCEVMDEDEKILAFMNDTFVPVGE